MNQIAKVRAVAVCCALGMPVGGVFGQANLLDADPNSPTFNNPSFERPDVPFALNQVDRWTLSGPKILTDNPQQTEPDRVGVGVFENPTDDPNTPGTQGRLGGMDGTQAGYIFSHSLPDFDTGVRMDHALSQVLTNQTYEAGKQYQLQIAFANAQFAPPPDSVLTFSLYAASSPSATDGDLIASDTITSTELNGVELVDFSTLSAAIAGEAVGKFIGIRISTHTEPTSVSNPGQFDFDHVQLTIVPEPAGTALLSIVATGLLATRRGRRA